MSKYLIFLTIALALSIIMTLSGAGTVIAFATAGLGLPLLFSATALVYGLCAWPAVALWDSVSGRRLRMNGQWSPSGLPR